MSLTKGAPSPEQFGRPRITRISEVILNRINRTEINQGMGHGGHRAPTRRKRRPQGVGKHCMRIDANGAARNSVWTDTFLCERSHVAALGSYVGTLCPL